MEQLYRDQFAHFINTTPKGEATWTREGEGVESLALSYNGQIDQFKSILDRNATANFTNYQVQSSISGKRIYKGDPIYEFLDEARRNMRAIETQYLEVELANPSDNGYIATKFNILIVIDEFLGENATISYSMYVRGNAEQGKATISQGVPTFVPTVL